MPLASIHLEKNTLILAGDWTAKGIARLQKNPLDGIVLPTYPLKIDASQLENFDSAGAWILNQLMTSLKNHEVPFQLENFSEQQKNLIELIEKQKAHLEKSAPPEKLNLFARTGKLTLEKGTEFLLWLRFIGEITVISLKLVAHPFRIPWKYSAAVIEQMGFRGLPIIAFLSFLIGVVLTYQIGLELKIYGANIYIVNLLGLAIFREFGPLITAIILAGRTTSAFTAQLGLMKANEEIDALRTMGFSPSELLIFPRIFALVLVVPLLTVWSDIFGIAGGMLMTNSILGISYTSFLTQFPKVVTLTSFMIGLCKAPVFAMIVAMVGCFHGFQVGKNSESLGRHTTRSVVLAIFLIIIADAIFSIILSWWNI